MTEKLPLSPAERIARAKEELANGVPEYAMASALIAIAELLQTNIAELLQTNIAETYIEGVKVGATTTADALGTVLGVLTPGGLIDPHDCASSR